MKLSKEKHPNTISAVKQIIDMFFLRPTEMHVENWNGIIKFSVPSKLIGADEVIRIILLHEPLFRTVDLKRDVITPNTWQILKIDGNRIYIVILGDTIEHSNYLFKEWRVLVKGAKCVHWNGICFLRRSFKV